MGQNLAIVSMATILATLLGRFHFRLADSVSSPAYMLAARQVLSAAAPLERPALEAGQSSRLSRIFAKPQPV